jgi:hypothetical protein
METNEMMKAILSRVLSQEVAHQEIWKKEDIERRDDEASKKEVAKQRDEVIKVIKDWMKQNDIKFSLDWYMSEF